MRMAGGCECGAVRFDAYVEDWRATACHCGQCRRWSGHFWVSIEVLEGTVRFHEKSGLKWRRSSDIAERGFCAECGASLFWRLLGDPVLSIAAGALDDPSRVEIGSDIFVEGWPRYYPLHSGVPSYLQDGDGPEASPDALAAAPGGAEKDPQ